MRFWGTFLSWVCGKLLFPRKVQFALVAACISHTFWRNLEWKQANKHHSPTERPQTHTFSVLQLSNTPHKGRQCCLRAPIENCHQSEALVMTLTRCREKTYCSPEKDDRERERLRKWRMRSEERVKSKGARKVDRTDNEGEIKRGQIGISSFSLLTCVQRPGSGPCSLPGSCLIGTQTSCPARVAFYLLPSLPSPPPAQPVTISYLQRIPYRHSSTSAIKACSGERKNLNRILRYRNFLYIS